MPTGTTSPWVEKDAVKRHAARWLAAAAVSLVAALLATVAPAPLASAAGTPDISLSASLEGETLFGDTTAVTLTASNSTGANGYNLSFNDVLPPGVSWAGGDTPTTTIADAPAAGFTTLIWENVSDLPPGSSFSIGYTVAHSTVTYAVGDSFSNAAGAYVDTDPRLVPDFDPVTGVATGDFTGSDTASDSTDIVPFIVTKSEPSPESELLRGVHDHQTVYTIEIRNNLVGSTTGFSLVDFLPAELEFLGCGGVDSSAAEEYPGSGPINPGNEPALANPCVFPTTVEVTSSAPDAPGPGTFTRVEWTAATLAGALGSADLGASGVLTIDYVAAVPLFANTTTWPGAAPAPASGLQASNLDNNTGASTEETLVEIGATNTVTAEGTWSGDGLDYTDDDTETVAVEDLHILKGASTGVITQGLLTTWTLTVNTSEYVGTADSIVVTDTVPDGLCPLGTGTAEGTAECDFGGEPEPSHPYTSATENADGTWTLVWDFDSIGGLGTMAANETRVVTFVTKTRTNYQESGADADPVLARDSWGNSVGLTGVVDTRPVLDDSSAGQAAGGVTILKEVAEPGAAPYTCGDGSGLTWEDVVTVGAFGPGDRVCWRLTVTFPGLLDTGGAAITDFLPAGHAYEAWVEGAANTVPPGDISFDGSGSGSGVLAWTIDDGSGFVDESLTLELVVSSLIDDPTAARSGDLVENLLKFSHANTAGDVFPLRDDADAPWTEPELTLTKGVYEVVRGVATIEGPNGPPAIDVDGVAVQGADVVTYQVTVENTGTRDALDVVVWDVLPAQISCSVPGEVASISDAGVCNVATDTVEWTVPTIGAGGTATLTYDVTIPAGVSPGQSFANDAGVREYESAANTGPADRFVYVPSSNIDPTQDPSANTDATDDDSDVFTPDLTIVKTRTTEIDESGNSGGSQATIGEEIDYTVTVTIPEGTTVYDAVLSDALGSRKSYVAGSAAATLNAVPLPTAGVTLDDTGDPITVDFPATYANPTGDDVLVLTFTAQVDDVGGNSRTGSSLGNTATFGWDDQGGNPESENDSANTTIVEPNLTIAKDHSGDDIADPAEIITYTVTVTNDDGPARVSVAHDLVVTDTIPPELTPVDGGGSPVPDGGTVPPDSGTWDLGTRTITWSAMSLDPGATATFDYDVEVADPVVGSSVLTNSVDVAWTSLPDPEDDEGERSSIASTTDEVTAPTASVAKSVAPATATIGTPLVYTLTVTIPANVVLYDVTVIDDLPTGVAFDGLDSFTCPGCVPGITVTELGTVGSDTATFFLDDLDPASTSDRIVTIVYDAHVRDVPSVDDGDVLTNSVNVYANTSSMIAGIPGSPPVAGDFAITGNGDTADVDIVEPTLTVDKDVVGQVADSDTRRAKPSEVLTYSIEVTNTGTSAAHDVTVTDTPNARVAASSIVDGAGYVVVDGDPTDGTLQWFIAGPIAPAGSVTIVYDIALWAATSGDEVAGGEAINVADVPSYFGVSAADRAANPSFGYRSYDDVTPDQVDVELDVASVGDFVWHDVDGDGVQDPGEPGIALVDVTVTYLGLNGVAGGGDDEVYATTTDAAGAWLVDELPGGAYTVVVDAADLPAGMTASYDLDDGTIGPDGAWAGVLGEGEDKADVDFGYTGTGSIGDTVWFDRDGDGVVDGDEYGLEGIDVTVTWAGPDGIAGNGDDVVYTDTTDGSGAWSVPLLPAGSYTVVVDSGDLPTGMVPTFDRDATLDNATTVALGAGAAVTDADFGYNGTGSIGDFVWLDRNGDGVQDGSEPGIGGVVVELTWPGEDGVIGGGDDELFVTTTDASGLYLFDGLPPGDYVVTVLGGLPAFVANTYDEDLDLDSSTGVSLANGADHATADFGYQGDGSIGDYVWLDLDGDGVQDVGEPGIVGAGVTVRWDGPDGILGNSDDEIFSTTTDGSGAYLVTGLPGGDYQVDVIGALPAAAINTFDEDLDLDSSTPVTLGDGEVHLTSDFGFQGNNAIGDFVWWDIDGDGVQDPGEPGLPGVEVTITWFGLDGVPGGGDDIVLAPLVTATDGSYLQTGLPDGSYGVAVTDGTTGLVNTFDEDGDLDQQTHVPGLTGATHDTADFGYIGLGQIGDTVYWDLDGNGAQDAGEPGFPGVDVTLTWYGPDDTFGTGDDVLLTTTTDADGGYVFDDLPPGTFRVEVDPADLPATLVLTDDPDGGADGISTVALTAGGGNLDQDFGYTGSGSIGDLVWYDIDGDGARGVDEPGVAGVEVTLTYLGVDGLAGGGDDVVLTTTTSTDGTYSFGALPGADYLVSIDPLALPAGLVADSDVDGGDPDESAVALGDGEDRDDVDFGIVGDARLHGTTWLDDDGDGVIDPDEDPTGGLTVRVTWAGPDGAVVIEIVSGVDGTWALENLPPGDYTVELVESSIPAGGGATTPISVAVALPAGGDEQVDFGIGPLADVGSTVWMDDDGDGEIDTGEEGIAGVTVELVDATDTVVATETTDANGDYLFVDVLPGVYTVRIVESSLPDDIGATYDRDGTADLETVVTLVGGTAILDANFGFQDTLPNTGADLRQIAGFALMVLAAGWLLLMALPQNGRRREQAA